MDYELAWLMIKHTVAEIVIESKGSCGAVLFEELKDIERRCKRPMNDPQFVKNVMHTGCDILEESVNKIIAE